MVVRVSRVLIEKDVVVPMRDGIRTVADLYRPADGPPVPALVCRNPYDKEVELRAVSILPSPAKLAERGYAVLVADCRGRFASEGSFTPFQNEGPDGYDTIEWTAAQPWCDGKVGIFGPSYLGVTTLLAARERPPSLRCAIPIITADDYFNDWVYRGGAFQYGFAGGWARGVAAAGIQRMDRRVRDGFVADVSSRATANNSRPLQTMPGLSVDGAAPWWSEWLEHDRLDDYWRSMSPARDYTDYQVPMLHIGGWWDLFAAGTFRNFAGMKAAGVPSQHLWIGPWAHTHFDQYFAELELGPTSSAAGSGTIAAFNRFIDEHLRGADRRLPTVHYFLLGANTWCDSDDWPPPQALDHALYLHSMGSANSARGDGALTPYPPTGMERADRFLFDPERPVPTTDPAGPRDQQSVEARDDVLCYTAAPLTEPLTVVGPVALELWAVSDAPDTDWTAKLVDVWPDGRAIVLCDGIVRARYRESLSQPRLLQPGKPEQYIISVGNIACRFETGHRLRIEVSSSNFPKFDANPNTGRPIATETEARVAIQQVLHEEVHPSKLQLCIMK